MNRDDWEGPRRSDLIDIACTIRLDRPRAWLIHDGTREAWIPKSIGEWNADANTMAMPEWLAKEKGLL